MVAPVDRVPYDVAIDYQMLGETKCNIKSCLVVKRYIIML